MASTSGPSGFAAPLKSTWQIISAPGDPPGSRVSWTARPSASRREASMAAWVDLPVPSPPSKVMNLPPMLEPPASVTRVYLGRYIGRSIVYMAILEWQTKRIAPSGSNIGLCEQTRTGRGFYPQSSELVHTGPQHPNHQFGGAIHRTLRHAPASDVIGGLQRHFEGEIFAPPDL